VRAADTPTPLNLCCNLTINMCCAPHNPTDSVFGGRNYCSPVGGLDRLSALSYPSACFICSRTVEIADCGCGERVCFATMNQALNPEGIVDPVGSINWVAQIEEAEQARPNASVRHLFLQISDDGFYR
jgi:hypothetical protein